MRSKLHSTADYTEGVFVYNIDIKTTRTENNNETEKNREVLPKISLGVHLSRSNAHRHSHKFEFRRLDGEYFRPPPHNQASLKLNYRRAKRHNNTRNFQTENRQKQNELVQMGEKSSAIFQRFLRGYGH